MSGGRFDYDQYKIGYIAEGIETEIENSGKKKDRKDFSFEDDYYPEYKPETIERFKEAIKYLKLAQIYAQRIDWFLSGDDGEESFHKRLNKELQNFEQCQLTQTK